MRIHCLDNMARGEKNAMNTVEGFEDSALAQLEGAQRYLQFFANNLAFVRNMRIYLRSQLEWMEHNDQTGLGQCQVS